MITSSFFCFATMARTDPEKHIEWRLLSFALEPLFHHDDGDRDVGILSHDNLGPLDSELRLGVDETHQLILFEDLFPDLGWISLPVFLLIEDSFDACFFPPLSLLT